MRFLERVEGDVISFVKVKDNKSEERHFEKSYKEIRKDEGEAWIRLFKVSIFHGALEFSDF